MSPLLKSVLLALVPKKRITAHLIGVAIGAAALLAGLSATELREEICKAVPVSIESK